MPTKCQRRHRGEARPRRDNIKFALGTGMVYSKLQFLPSETTVPLLPNHDEKIGVVRKNVRWAWVDQIWHVALWTVDRPPAWMQRGTRASFGYRQLGSYDVNGWTCVSNALVDEVPIVGPGFEPVEPCAEVLGFSDGRPRLLTLPAR